MEAGMPRKARIDAPGALHHKKPMHELIRKDTWIQCGQPIWLQRIVVQFDGV